VNRKGQGKGIRDERPTDHGPYGVDGDRLAAGLALTGPYMLLRKCSARNRRMSLTADSTCDTVLRATMHI
jgi:hypothetical protein